MCLWLEIYGAVYLHFTYYKNLAGSKVSLIFTRQPVGAAALSMAFSAARSDQSLGHGHNRLQQCPTSSWPWGQAEYFVLTQWTWRNERQPHSSTWMGKRKPHGDCGLWGVGCNKGNPSTHATLSNWELLKKQPIQRMAFFYVSLVLGSIFSLVPLVTDSRNPLAPA